MAAAEETGMLPVAAVRARLDAMEAARADADSRRAELDSQSQELARQSQELEIAITALRDVLEMSVESQTSSPSSPTPKREARAPKSLRPSATAGATATELGHTGRQIVAVISQLKAGEVLTTRELHDRLVAEFGYTASAEAARRSATTAAKNGEIGAPSRGHWTRAAALEAPLDS